MARFALAAELETSSQKLQFAEYCNDNNLKWWHRVENFWLIDSGEVDFDINDILIKLSQLGAPKAFIIQVMPNSDYAGLFHSAELDSSMKWVKANWGNDMIHTRSGDLPAENPKFTRMPP